MDFKIINEQTIRFKNNKRIFVILSSDKDSFGVEVDTNSKTFGKIKIKNKSEAVEMFELLSKRIKRFKQSGRALEFVKSVFSLRNQKKIYFAIKYHGRKMPQHEIGNLVRKFGFIPRVKYNKNLKGDISNGHIKISVIFGDQKVGDFCGQRFGDLKFEISNNNK